MLREGPCFWRMVPCFGIAQLHKIYLLLSSDFVQALAASLDCKWYMAHNHFAFHFPQFSVYVMLPLPLNRMRLPLCTGAQCAQQGTWSYPLKLHLFLKDWSGNPICDVLTSCIYFTSLQFQVYHIVLEFVQTFLKHHIAGLIDFPPFYRKTDLC